MNPRITVIMVLVLALLGAYVYYYQNPSNPPTPTPTPASDTSVSILNLKVDDIVGVQVTTALSSTIARKDNAVWFLDAPSKEEADVIRLTSFVGQLATLKATRALSETPTNLQPFGLVTGTLTVVVKLKDNRSETIRFGNQTVQTGVYYLQRVGDTKVYLGGGSIYNEAQQLVTMPPLKPTPLPTPPPLPTPEPSATPRP